MTRFFSMLDASIASSEQLGALHGDLYPQEAVLLGSRASRARQLEFAAGRTCARHCLTALGAATAPILRGHAGQPLFPVGFVGSITHCDRYCAAALASTEHYLAIGIDAAVNQPLTPMTIACIATPLELTCLPASGTSCIHWPTLLFSIKESVSKALFFACGAMPAFHQLDVRIDAEQQSFTAALSYGACADRMSGLQTNGRFRQDMNLLFTACCIPRP